MRKVRIYVSGRVQGVGFRYNTLSIARNLKEITGYVRNLDDGMVYIEACGPETKIAMFIDALKDGQSSFARVASLDVMEDQTIECRDAFDIL